MPPEPPIRHRLGAAGFRSMIAGARLGVFDALAAGPLTVAELADAINGDPAGVRTLVDALVAFGHLRHDEAGLTTTLTSEALDTELFWHDVLFEHWADLEDTIRTGRPRDFYPWLAERPATAARLRRTLARAAEALADEIAAALPPAATVLDLGGGHGDHAVELCRRRPGMRITVLDTLAALRPDAPDRIAPRAGDYLTDDLGSGHDLVLLFNVLHGHGPADCRELIHRAAKSLSPKGHIAILDHNPPPDLKPTGAEFLATFDLTLWHGQGGAIHPFTDLTAWLAEAGLTNTRTVPLAASPLASLLIASRP